MRHEASADIGWVHGSKQSKHVALERWLIDTPWLLEPPKAIQQNPSRWEHGGWMDVPVRIEEASYFRTRWKQRWEWVHGSKPVALVRWQAGKAVNASRFPCASPSAKAEGSADILTYYRHILYYTYCNIVYIYIICLNFAMYIPNVQYFFSGVPGDLRWALWEGKSLSRRMVQWS